MTGYMRQKHNIPVGEVRIGKALSAVSPIYTSRRRATARTATNMGCEVQKFCVSGVSCIVAKFGIDIVVKSWNAHTIPGFCLITF